MNGVFLLFNISLRRYCADVENAMNRLDKISRLTLGTAQLGMSYGVVNSTGDIGVDGAVALLDAAWESGVTCFDTARVYGESETRIGAWIAKRQNTPIIISKIPALDGADDIAEIGASFTCSTSALGLLKIDGLLCHRAADLSRPAVRKSLEKLVADGRIERFGVSVYSPDQLFKALEIDTIGIVQLPLSIANARFLDQGAISAAAARGVLVFARSVYLQGLLLTTTKTLPGFFEPLAGLIRQLHDLAHLANTDVATLALAAVNVVPGVHSIVIGAETKAQLAGTLTALNKMPTKTALIDEAWSLFKNVPLELVDPARWPAH